MHVHFSCQKRFGKFPQRQELIRILHHWIDGEKPFVFLLFLRKIVLGTVVAIIVKQTIKLNIEALYYVSNIVTCTFILDSNVLINKHTVIYGKLQKTQLRKAVRLSWW